MKDANLSFKDLDEVILVGGSIRIPAVQELVRKMTGKEPNVNVNPDEVVALGPAVQVCPYLVEINYHSSGLQHVGFFLIFLIGGRAVELSNMKINYYLF